MVSCVAFFVWQKKREPVIGCANCTLTKKANYWTCQFVTCTGASWQTVRDRCDRVSCFRVIYFILFSGSLADKDDHKRWSMLGSVFWICLGRAIVCTLFVRHGLTIIGTCHCRRILIDIRLGIIYGSLNVAFMFNAYTSDVMTKGRHPSRPGFRLNATAPFCLRLSLAHRWWWRIKSYHTEEFCSGHAATHTEELELYAGEGST